MFASIVGGFLSLTWWQMPLAFVGIMLFISGPSMLIAALKLHRRNLAPVLDASGWAINTKALINIPFGHLLTGTAKLPKNAERQLIDPFAEKKTHWQSYLVLMILLAALLFAWQQNLYQQWVNKPVKNSVTVSTQITVPSPAASPAPNKP
jgi:hypothetical protein